MRSGIPMADSKYYDKIARQVAGGNLLGKHVFFLSPLYPYSLAIAYRVAEMASLDKVFPSDIAFARYVQCTVGSLSCVMLYWIGCLTMGRGVGILAGLLSATYGLFIYYDGILMPSTLILFLHLLALLLFILAAKRESWVWWLMGGIVSGFCALSHGTALLMVGAVVGWILIGPQRCGFRRRLLRSFLVLAGCLPMIALVTIRNYVVGEDFVLLTSNAGRVLFVGNNPTATGSFKAYPTSVWGATLSTYASDRKRKPGDPLPSEVSRQYVDQVLQFIRDEPRHWGRLLVKKLRLFFHGIEIGINDQFYFAKRFSTVLSWPLPTAGMVIPLGLTGILCTVRSWRKHLLVVAFFGTQVLSFTLMFVLGRYRLVAVACLMFFAAAQMVWWVERIRSGGYVRLALSIGILGLMGLVVNRPLAGFDRERGFGQQYAYVAGVYRSERDFDAMIREYEQAVRFDFEPWGNGHRRRAQCYAKLGEEYHRRRQWADAIRAYREGLAEIELEKEAFDRESMRKNIAAQLKLSQKKQTQSQIRGARRWIR